MQSRSPNYRFLTNRKRNLLPALSLLVTAFLINLYTPVAYAQGNNNPSSIAIGYAGEPQLGAISYMRTRVYITTTGRFAQRDNPFVAITMLENPALGNTFFYTNNPVNLIDPKGRSPQKNTEPNDPFANDSKKTNQRGPLDWVRRILGGPETPKDDPFSRQISPQPNTEPSITEQIKRVAGINDRPVAEQIKRVIGLDQGLNDQLGAGDVAKRLFGIRDQFSESCWKRFVPRFDMPNIPSFTPQPIVPHLPELPDLLNQPRRPVIPQYHLPQWFDGPQVGNGISSFPPNSSYGAP